MTDKNVCPKCGGTGHYYCYCEHHQYFSRSPMAKCEKCEGTGRLPVATPLDDTGEPKAMSDPRTRAEVALAELAGTVKFGGRQVFLMKSAFRFACLALDALERAGLRVVEAETALAPSTREEPEP